MAYKMPHANPIATKKSSRVIDDLRGYGAPIEYLRKGLRSSALERIRAAKVAGLAGDLPIWEREPVPLASLKKGIARSAMGVADL